MKGKWAIAICLVLSMVLIPSALAGASQTIVVEPTNEDDTANIQAAFAAAGLGGVVELTAGDFYLSHPVVIRNWSGTVRGQGKDRTKLHTIADPFPREPLPEDAYGPYSVAGMLMFMYDDGAVGELLVQGLGFRPTGLSIPEPTFGNEDIVPIFIGTGKLGAVAHVDTTWRDLRIEGDRSDRYPDGNMIFGMWFIRVPGTHVMSDVDFATSSTIGFVTVLLSGGKFIVGGPHPEDRVTFTDIGWTGIFGFSHTNLEMDVSNVQARDSATTMTLYALDNCRVHMSGVETWDASGAAIGPCFALGCNTQPSTYLLEHNVVRQAPGTTWAGFEMWQDWDVKSDIVIRNNRISGEGSFPFGPIFTLGARNAVITNNIITGSGPAAMYLGAASWMGADDSGLMAKGNNVQGWTVDGGPFEPDWHGMAPIWLGAYTSGITVVGSGNLRTTVLDESGANILVGVNSQGAQVGQAVRDAMQARIEAKKLFMSKMP